ncbi:TspO/MBR family protein [Fodinicurvata fenggangensis]|uniref:TspO/MBR family protein n=1 Tax=Fodinicurvata fenggangensis TaxID=1121830 RepID=UPI00047E7AE2|nr:TspO/MBR family protein [Fodinicurvata fenggangensis]
MQGRRNWLVLVGFLVLTLAVGQIGSLPTRAALESWYSNLTKPAFTPPDLAFPIVWTLIYIMMAVAAWLVWCRGGWRRTRGALGLWGLQLALNLLWTFLFFGLRSPGLALLEAIILLLVLAATLVAFDRHSRAAAWLLVPYLLWTGYAIALTFEIWRLN